MGNQVIIGRTTNKDFVGEILSVKRKSDIAFFGIDNSGNDAYINKKDKNPYFTSVCVLVQKANNKGNKNSEDWKKISRIRKDVRIAMLECSRILSERYDYETIREKVYKIDAESKFPMKEYCSKDIYGLINWDELHEKGIFKEKEIREYIFDDAYPIHEKFKDILVRAITSLVRIREFIEKRFSGELNDDLPLGLDNVKLAECIVEKDITKFFEIYTYKN